MKTNDLLTAGLVAVGGYFALKLFGGASGPRMLLASAAPNQIAASAPAGRVSEQKSAVETRYLPIPTMQPSYDPYLYEDAPSLGQKIETIGTAAERSLDVIQNVFTGITDLFGGSSGPDKAPGAVQTSSVSFLDVPPGVGVVV